MDTCQRRRIAPTATCSITGQDILRRLTRLKSILPQDKTRMLRQVLKSEICGRSRMLIIWAFCFSTVSAAKEFIWARHSNFHTVHKFHIHKCLFSLSNRTYISCSPHCLQPLLTFSQSFPLLFKLPLFCLDHNIYFLVSVILMSHRTRASIPI